LKEEQIQSTPTLASENLTETEVEELRKEMIAIKEQKKNENEEFMQKVLDIVGRFYPNELNKILQDTKAQEAAMTAETFVAISEAECNLIEVVIDIIEEKDITTEEEKCLKKYLNGTDFKLK